MVIINRIASYSASFSVLNCVASSLMENIMFWDWPATWRALLAMGMDSVGNVPLMQFRVNLNVGGYHVESHL